MLNNRSYPFRVPAAALAARFGAADTWSGQLEQIEATRLENAINLNRSLGVALESRGRWGFASFGTCRSLARPCLANVSDMTLEDSQIHLAGLVTLYSNWSPLEWWGIEWVCPDEQFVPQLA